MCAPDFSINARYGRVKETWMTPIGNAIYSSPVLCDGRVYVGDDLGLLNCLDAADGRLLWRFAAKNRIIGTPAAADGTVVFGSADGNIYGIDAKKGKLRWKVETSEAVLGAVTIDGRVAYVGCSDRTFRAIDVRTGRRYGRLPGRTDTSKRVRWFTTAK